jgi:hypothetical protein
MKYLRLARLAYLSGVSGLNFLTKTSASGNWAAFINPILHTAWLESHALTLKINTAKYYLGEKPVFCIPFSIFS